MKKTITFHFNPVEGGAGGGRGQAGSGGGQHPQGGPFLVSPSLGRARGAGAGGRLCPAGRGRR